MSIFANHLQLTPQNTTMKKSLLSATVLLAAQVMYGQQGNKELTDVTDEVFTLTGQCVNASNRGIHIINGRKMLMK